MRTKDKILIELAETVDYWSYVSGLYNKRSHDILGLRMGKKDRKVEQAVRRLVSVGEIEKEVSQEGEIRYKITSLGLKTLNRTININKINKKPWDKKWRIVIFDIEERSRNARERVRNHLRQLGFGLLQESVWISPHPVIDEIEELFKTENIEIGVLFFEAEKVGSYSNEEIAMKAWDLPAISERYSLLIENCKKNINVNSSVVNTSFFGQYLEILKEDPYLPDEILPADWGGREARKIFDEIRKKIEVNL